jgi:predicted RNA binding protein YcfA (HicA-like mRNA interferase family)
MASATAREFQRVARIVGFILKRQKGSHGRWNDPDESRQNLSTVERKSDRLYSIKFFGNWA